MVSEYLKLDKSVIEIVDKAIDKMEERADQIGTVLKNYQNTKLAVVIISGIYFPISGKLYMGLTYQKDRAMLKSNPRA